MQDEREARRRSVVSSLAWVLARGLLGLFAASCGPAASPGFELTPIGRIASPEALPALYDRYRRSIVVIDEVGYAVPPECLAARSLGGGQEARSLGGGQEARSLGGGQEARSLGGGQEARSLGGGQEARSLGGGQEARSLEGGQEARALGGGQEARSLEGGQEARSLEGGQEARSLGGGQEARSLGGGQEARSLGGGQEARSLGGRSTRLECRNTKGSLEILGAQGPIFFYDGNRLERLP